MFHFDPLGWAVNDQIKVKHFPHLKVGTLSAVHGIIVHQTAASTAAATFSQYGGAASNGAHFLIDKDGTIYQTASVL